MQSFKEAAEGRENNLDFLRFMLAAAVVFSHSFLLSLGDESRDLLFACSRGALTFSRAAVAGFFIISGFLITKSWVRRPELADFARRRALRIFPGYVFTAAVCLWIVAPWSSGAFAGHLRLAKDLLFVNPPRSADVFAQNPYHGQVNGSLWTIRYELWCYVAVVFLGSLKLFGSARPAFVVWLAAVIFDTVNQHFRLIPALHAVPLIGFIGVWPKFIAYFFAGSLFYLLRSRIPRSPTAFLTALILLAGFVATGVGVLVLTGLCVGGSYTLFYLAFSRRVRLQHFGRFGDFSYGVYLYAWPIQQLFVQFAPSMRNPWALYGASFALSTVCAFLSWHLVEKPFLRKARKPSASSAPLVMRTIETSKRRTAPHPNALCDGQAAHGSSASKPSPAGAR